MNWIYWGILTVILAAAVLAAPSPVPKWFDKKLVKLNANTSNYTDLLLSTKHLKYSPVGLGYISEMDGWASWGLKTQGNKTLVRVWKLPRNDALRCTLTKELTPTFYNIWDYSNECN